MLAIDLGGKRTGVALGDGVTGVVTALDAVLADARADAGRERLRGVARVVQDQLGVPCAGSAHGAVVVIGLPLNMDGSEGPAAREARAFGEALRALCGWNIEYQDERLTSADADWAMAGSGLTHDQKKRRRDSLAAAAILRDYLSRTRPSSGTGGAEGVSGAG